MLKRQLVVLMLGTSDFQSMHTFNAWHSAQGLLALIAAIRTAPIEPGMPIPPILVVAPPAIQTPQGPIAPKFEGAETKCAGLAEAYRKASMEADCHFFYANAVVSTSKIDGIHLDLDQHLTLGKALAEVVQPLLFCKATPP